MGSIVTYYDAMYELWFAYDETASGEGIAYGYGLTEESAIMDLKDMLDNPVTISNKEKDIVQD